MQIGTEKGQVSQDVVLEHMRFEDLIEPECESLAILDTILRYPLEIVSFALGELGVRLYAFAQAVDHMHPHTHAVFAEIAGTDPNFEQDIKELLEFADYAGQKQITRLLPDIRSKILTDEKLCRLIDSPVNNRYRIRLLPSREDRDRVRAEKKTQTIDLSTVVKKGQEAWLAQPGNFNSFVRFNVAYQDEISLAIRKSERYKKLGCTSLANMIKDSLESFKNQVHEVYYGFNRITITNAALILAKTLGCKLFTKIIDVDDEKTTCWIRLPVEFLHGYTFEDPKTPISCTGKSLNLEYEPRVYPLYKFWNKAPESVVKIIDYLEAFPKATGRAIFDNYAVIVPGPAMPANAKIFSPDKQQIPSGDDPRESLDNLLIDQGLVTPILLGERDGKCFFVCFFC